MQVLSDIATISLFELNSHSGSSTPLYSTSSVMLAWTNVAFSNSRESVDVHCVQLFSMNDIEQCNKFILDCTPLKHQSNIYVQCS